MTTHYTPIQFLPTRLAALSRLDEFKNSMGHAYAQHRNFDLGPNNRTNTSLLSPYISTRLLLEEEVVATALSLHSYTVAEKFIQEVFWRTYWKGWLELRPGVWRDYLSELSRLRTLIDEDNHLSVQYQSATSGKTHLDCFNAWIHELLSTGYLHNHARMWFASIWIYTLKLPWELGADFFLTHLLDGDVASNTLSWRWVAGLHTKGKQYIATPENIQKYTQGRFNPTGLRLCPAEVADSLPQFKTYEPTFPKPDNAAPSPTKKSIILIHGEDLSVERSPVAGLSIAEIFVLHHDIISLQTNFSAHVNSFKHSALEDQVTRVETCLRRPVKILTSQNELLHFLAQTDSDSTQIVCLKPTVGFWRDFFDSSITKSPQIFKTLRQVERSWDQVLYPKATGGFFKFKKAIPQIIEKLPLSS